MERPQTQGCGQRASVLLAAVIGMMDIDTLNPGFYGCDTETYNTPSFGLKSIQIVGTDGMAWYLTEDDWALSDDEIRHNIVSKFVGWMEHLPTDSVVYFYNLDFDFSQMVKELVTVWYKPTDRVSFLSSGEISVIETP